MSTFSGRQKHTSSQANLFLPIFICYVKNINRYPFNHHLGSDILSLNLFKVWEGLEVIHVALYMIAPGAE